MKEILQSRMSRRTALTGGARLAAGILLGVACGTDKDNGADTTPEATQTGAPVFTSTPDFRTATAAPTLTATIETETPVLTATPDSITATASATATKTETPVLTATPDHRTATSAPPPAPTIEVKAPTPVPAAVSKQEVSTPPPTPENFPWSREEVLFGLNAGFQKLREGGIVTVYIPPDLSEQITEEAIAPWNNLGIELRGIPFLELTPDLVSADIRFLSSPLTWVEPVNAAGKTDFENTYNTVTIHTSTGENGSTRLTNIAASHEMGHAAFGFVDFLNPTEWAAYENKTARGYIHPQNGSDPQKPYVGAMNYVYWSQRDVWFGKDDRSLLKLAGYA